MGFDSGMPTVGAYVNMWETFQVAQVRKNRPTYSTESYAPSYYGLLVMTTAMEYKLSCANRGVIECVVRLHACTITPSVAM